MPGGVVGQAWYELGVRDDRLRTGVAGAEQQLRRAGTAGERAFGVPVQNSMDQTGASATRLGGALGGVTTKASGFGGVMKNVAGGVLMGVGIGAFMGVTAAAGALVGGLTSSISAASDLNETITKTQVVFGEGAPAILKWGESSATAFGLSKNAALGAAAQYGNLFVSLKLSQAESATMSTRLVELAGDLASFNNVDPTEALDALRSGLVGETEPLRRFGVNLNDATIRQKAFELGLMDSVKGGLTPAIKAQASYALILDQTTTAQGDFARTSEGLANQQRISAARMEDAMARVGTAILPIATKVVPLLADALVAVVEAIAGVVEAVSKWIDENQVIIDVLRSVVELGIGLLVAHLQALVGIATTVFGIVGDVVSNFAGIIKPIFEAIIGSIRNVMDIAAQIPGPWQESAATMRDTLAKMEADAKHWGETTKQDVGKTPAEAAAAMRGGTPAMQDAAQESLGDPMADAAADGRKEAVKEAKITPRDMAKALLDNQFSVKDAAESLKETQKTALSKTKEIAAIEGFLTGDRLTKALRSSKPAVRAEAEAWRAEAEDRLLALKNDVPEIALDTGRDYATTLGETKADVARNAARIRTSAIDELREGRLMADNAGENTGTSYAGGIRTKAGSAGNAGEAVRNAARGEMRYNASPWGQHVGSTYSSGIRSTIEQVQRAARLLATTQANILRTGSPAKEGPLSEGGGPDGWGRHFGLMYARGLEATIPVAQDALGRLLGGVGAPSVAVDVSGVLGARGPSVTVVHEIRDPGRSLASIGTTPGAVADALAQGLDATGFLRSLRHEASMPGFGGAPA